MDHFLNAGFFESIQTVLHRLFGRILALLPEIVVAIAVLFITWVIATAVHRLTAKADSSMHYSLLRQTSYCAVWLIGIFIALNVLGVNATAAMTGLGLGGVAIGFALKDILSNFISGILILLGRTFEIGDQIVIGDTEGTVERMEVRATHIRTYDGRLVLVPNGEVLTSRITNNTESDLRRVSIMIYLDYREELERAMSTILDAVRHVQGVAKTPAPSMRLRELTTEYLRIEARIWTESRRHDVVLTASNARIAIVNALIQAGFELPYPNEQSAPTVAVSHENSGETEHEAGPGR